MSLQDRFYCICSVCNVCGVFVERGGASAGVCAAGEPAAADEGEGPGPGTQLLLPGGRWGVRG